MTESSKDIVIVAKNKKIKELESENKDLKEQLMILRGKLYETIQFTYVDKMNKRIEYR